MIRLILILLLFPLLACGQDVYEVSNKVEMPGTTQEELYKRANIWFANSFRSAKNVIQLQDKEDGKIIAHGSIEYNAPSFNPGTNWSGYFRFMLTFECKDGKYRYAITDISHESPYSCCSVGAFNNRKNIKKKVLEAAILNVELMAKKLELAMYSKSKSDDW